MAPDSSRSAKDRLDCVTGRAGEQMPAGRDVVDETTIAERAIDLQGLSAA
jgi:hypothetical protein